MLLVGFVLFACHQLPIAVVGEKGIRLVWGVIYFCQQQKVGKGHGLFVYACAANNKHLFLVGTSIEGILQRGVCFCPRELSFGMREHNIAPIGKCAFRQ